MNYPRIILAGTHSGVGKTTLTCGIMLAMIKRGLNVQPFKTGPDYIDPTYHKAVTGVDSCNLDTWLLPRHAILELFKKRAGGSDMSIIEGVMGLYDGLKDKEIGSTAYLAKMLNCPVILIIDARSLSRSAGAIVFGYKEFDRDVKIRGVILNNIGGVNHYLYIKSVIENKNRVPVLGYLPRNPALKLPERHLGLIPTLEKKLDGAFYNTLADIIEKNIDIYKILKIARQAGSLPRSKDSIFVPRNFKGNVTIGIAKDKAFNFYYQDNLEILKSYGAQIVEFSPLADKKLPEGIDGLYIGGGFPELFASQLSKNIKLKKEIYRKAKDGLPIYAECGGLMYLVERLKDFKNRNFPMVGIFKGSVSMSNKFQALGYANLKTIRDNILSKKGDTNRAHVFHWSYLDGIVKKSIFAYKVVKNNGSVFYDGLVKWNVMASYAHLHFASNLNFAKNFIRSCRKCKLIE